ncbi:MAG TPA: NAD(P)H-quinone oxidoreductase [Puia sp.]|jgi:putative PIG3 family NAD(P)H quinone oxidoreductase|nr:NAD(P)H-quinone oxidoreductase [Puia sp.]
MKAIWITRKGGPEVLEVRDTPEPVPAQDEVLIRVKAAGLNRSDVYSRGSRSYGNDRPEIPGLEVSGTIVSCGKDVARWRPGDTVCALVTGGGYAEYVAVPAGQCLPVPDGWTSEDAASLPETVLTVWSNVWKTAGLRPGENLLVHGGSSGIGSTAIQLAVAFGNPIYTTAGTDEKCRWCAALGATKAINYKTQDFQTALKDVGIDVILDMTGGDFTSKNLRLLSADGRLVLINAMRGKEATIDLTEVMSRRLVITGSMLKPRSAEFKAQLTADVEKQVWPLIALGALRPLIYARFPLEKAAEAQRLMESGEHMGKILLVVG